MVNNGPAVAHNVRLATTINSVGQAWQGVITDVNSFHTKRFPSTIPITVQSKKIDTLYYFQDLQGNNGFEYSIDVLPVGASAQIFIQFSPLVDTKVYSTERVMVIDFSQYPDLGSYFRSTSDFVEEYLHKRYYVANFTTELNCENCENVDNKSPFFPVSSLGAWGYSVLDVGSITETLQLHADYRVPGNSTIPIDNAPINVSFQKDANGEFALVDTHR